MVVLLDYLTEGPRIFLSSLKNRFFQAKYNGNATEICKKITKECWNGRYFQTSTRNFAQFWTRDFGWCTSSLLKLKYHNEVHHTIRYALNRFKEANKITTTITPRGRVMNFPTQAVDSLPWFIHSMKISKFPYYAHKTFLNKEINKFFKTFINPHTGLVKPDEHFSSMKDFAIRKSSCYDNCMVGMLAKDLRDMKLDNPFNKFNYSELVKRHFWNGEYFYDDLQKRDYVAGDANIFPFLFGLIDDRKMLKSAMQAIESNGLNDPIPLKYTSSREHVSFIWQESLMRNYESDAIWLHMGPLYVKLLQQVDKNKAIELKQKYTDLIQKHRNFPEVLTSSGKPFQSIYYYCDFGMLWAANYLTL